MQRSAGGVFDPGRDRSQDLNPERLQDRYQSRIYDEDPDGLPHRDEKEITLGSAGLLLLGVGLFGLCALCFGLGYAAGHRSPAEAMRASAEVADQVQIQAGQKERQAKPMAGQETARLAEGPAASPDGVTSPEGGENSAAAAPAGQTAGGVDGVSGDPIVRTALTTQPAGAQTSAARLGAVTESTSIMVQIATVAHPEDAEVLVGALRKRGYAVSSRRDPLDGMLHVEVGPFASRSEALAMRQRLLNDGYNAVVQ